MVEINGIGGASGPRPQRADAAPERRDSSAPRIDSPQDGAPQDGVVISSAAQAAARLTQLIQAADNLDDVRADKVEAARQRIERGDYKQRDIVATVADRVAKYL